MDGFAILCEGIRLIHSFIASFFIFFKIWDLQWGSLYNPNVAGGVPQDYKTRIKILEEEINKFKIPRMSTVTKTSYKQFEPYEEWHDHKRKSLERFKDDE